MESAATKAARIGWDAMTKAITEDGSLNDHRKVGALITAAAKIYLSALHHVIEDLDGSSAKLAYGIFEDIVAEEMAKVAAKAGNNGFLVIEHSI